MKKKPRNYKKVLTSSRYILIAGVFIFSVVAAGAYSFVVPNSNVSLNSTYAAGTWPTEPPAQICGSASILDGPSTPPAGAVVVPAGDNEDLTPNWSTFSQDNTTFWFEPGVHTIGNGEYNQIQPGNNSTFIGAPGAILDGQGSNRTAFGGYNENVTIKHLEIRNFAANHDQGVVNHDMAAGWTISNNYMHHNSAAAVFAATDNVVSYNCLINNGQYGFQVAGYGIPDNVLLDHNEIANNNTANTEASVAWEGCGCSGGAKFWAATDVTVTNNYVHDNMGIGLWADTINIDFLFAGNWIENNEGPGIMYEVSYNFRIENNVFKGNGNVWGPGNPGFPTGAIYISESGSDSSVTAPGGNDFSESSDIQNNIFIDNWSGVVLWENADRFCSNGLPTTDCTLVNPSVYTVQSCAANLADPAKNGQNATPNYFNDCRWLTKNVKVHDNIFNVNPANIPQCTANRSCGTNSVFANYGVVYPYNNSDVATNIAFNQGNEYYNNVYNGPWYFRAWAQSNQSYPLSFSDWRKPVTTKCTTSSETSAGTCNSGFGQDSGSTYNVATVPDPLPNDGNTKWGSSDINQDGKVDIVDLSILLSNWSKSGTSDIDNSGKVDIFDLSILLSNWS